MISHVLIWKTCRVLANEARLRILKLLMQGPELCVSNIAQLEGMTIVVASRHLRLLHESGLVVQAREGKWTFYKAVAPRESFLAHKIYKPLKIQLLNSKNQIPKLLKSATAFTHPRRIEIVKMLSGTPQTFDALQDLCTISSRAMTRHLDKLLSRGLVQKNPDNYRLLSGKTEFEKILLDACCH